MARSSPKDRATVPSGKARKNQKSEEDILELADDFIYALNVYGEPVHQARNTVHCQSEIFNEDIVQVLVNGFNYSAALDKRKVLQSTDISTCTTEGADELILKLGEACRTRALQGCSVKKLAELLYPAIQGRNFSQLSTFRTRHPSLSQAPMPLDDLLTRSCPSCICSDTITVFGAPPGLLANNDNGHSSRAMVSTVGTSLDRVQEFGKPLCFSLLHLKQALGQVTITTSEQLGEAHLLCVDLEYPEPQFATPEDPPAELRLTAQLQEGPTQGLVPFSASGLTLGRAGMKQFQKPGCRHLCNKHLLKELLSEFNYSIFLDKWKIFEANDNRQCRAETAGGDIFHKLVTESNSLLDHPDGVPVHQYQSILQGWSENASGEITRKLVRESIYLYDPVTMEVYRCDTRSEDWCKTTHGDIIHQLVNDSLNYYYVARVQVPPYHTIVHCCSKKSKSDIVLLLVHKSIYNILSDRVQGKRANTTMQCWPKMRGLKFLGVKSAPGHSSHPGTLEDFDMDQHISSNMGTATSENSEGFL